MSRDTSRYPTGKITFDQEKCLWRCRQVLTREMDSSEMTKELGKRRVLGDKDQRKIRSKPTNTEKNQALLDIIMNRTSEGFLAFVRALDATGHKVAYDTVLNALASESKNTLQKLVEGGKASEFTTGAVFVDSGSEKSPTHQEVEEEEEPPKVRRPPVVAPPPPPQTVVVRHSSVEEKQAQALCELRKDLETAKQETIGLREEKTRLADADKQKKKHIERLSEMVEAGREKIAKLLAENRHLKRELEDLKRDYESAKQEIKYLKERLEKAEPRTARNESRATRASNPDDKISREMAKHFDRMKTEILDEIKKDQGRPHEDLIPVLDHQNRRILSYQLPPSERLPTLPIGIPPPDNFGASGVNGISGLNGFSGLNGISGVNGISGLNGKGNNGVGYGRRATLGNGAGNSLLHDNSKLNGPAGPGRRNDLGFKSLDLGKPGDPATNNLGASKRITFGSMDDGLAGRRNAIWNEAVQTGLLNKQRNGLQGLAAKPGQKKDKGLKALEKGQTNDVWNGAVVSKTLKAQPSWLYQDGDIPLWFHHVDHSARERNHRNEALVLEKSPRVDEPYTFRWSVDTHGKKLLEGFITARRDPRDPPGRLPRRHKALTLREL